MSHQRVATVVQCYFLNKTRMLPRGHASLGWILAHSAGRRWTLSALRSGRVQLGSGPRSVSGGCGREPGKSRAAVSVDGGLLGALKREKSDGRVISWAVSLPLWVEQFVKHLPM